MLKSRFGRGVFWNLLATGLSQGSVFLTTVILARLLGKDTFGAFAIVQSTLVTVISIAQFATGLTATKFVAELRDTNKARAGTVLGFCAVAAFGFGLAATIIVAIASGPLATDVLLDDQLASAILLAAPFIVFSAVNGYQTGALIGLEAYRSLSVAGALAGATHILVCTIAAIYWQLEGALIGLVLSALFRWFVYGAVLARETARQGIAIQRRQGLREAPLVLKFAVPAAMSGLTAMPAIWAGNAVLVRQNEGYSELALYTAASNVRMLVMLLPIILSGVGLAILNNLRGNRSHGAYREMFWMNVSVNGFIALAAAILFALLGDYVLAFFGPDFRAGYAVLLVLMASTIPEAVALAVAQAVQSQGRMWRLLLFVALPRDALFICLAVVLVPAYGAVGLGVTYAAAQLCAVLTVVILVRMLGIAGKS